MKREKYFYGCFGTSAVAFGGFGPVPAGALLGTRAGGPGSNAMAENRSWGGEGEAGGTRIRGPTGSGGTAVPPDWGSEQFHFVRLWPFLALGDHKADRLAFLEGLETITPYGGKVNEQIRAGGPGDEPKPFFLVEPFYGPCFFRTHSVFPL